MNHPENKVLKGIYMPHRHRWAWEMSYSNYYWPEKDGLKQFPSYIDVKFNGYILQLDNETAELFIKQLTEMLNYKKVQESLIQGD